MFKVSNVSHITYPTTDVDKSVDFLVNTMGFYRQRHGATTYVGIGETLFELGKRDAIPLNRYARPPTCSVSWSTISMPPLRSSQQRASKSRGRSGRRHVLRQAGCDPRARRHPAGTPRVP